MPNNNRPTQAQVTAIVILTSFVAFLTGIVAGEFIETTTPVLAVIVGIMSVMYAVLGVDLILRAFEPNDPNGTTEAIDRA